MQIKLEELRNLIKETITETNFGLSVHGGLASPAFNRTGFSGDSTPEIPLDPVGIANAVVVAIKQLIDPMDDSHEPSARAAEIEQCRKMLQGFGEEAINDAGEAAADALINTSQREKTRRSVRMYEKKQ